MDLLLKKTPAKVTAEYYLPAQPLFLPLQVAALNGRTAAVDRLLQEPDIEVNATTRNGQSSLHLAIHVGHINVVRRLLRARGINPNIENGIYSHAPLHTAVRLNRTDIVKCLLSDARVRRHRRRYAATLVHLAAEANTDTSTIKVLAEDHGFRANVRDRLQRTPLHKCAGRRGEYSEGADAMLEYLLSLRDVEPNARDHDAATPLHYAVRSKNVDAVRKLMRDPRVDENARTRAQHLTPLFEAAESGCCETVRYLLNSKHVHVNSKTRHRVHIPGQHPQEVTALHISVLERHPQTTRMLIDDARCDVNAQDEHGYTALHYATLGNNRAILEMLLDNGRATVAIRTHGRKSAIDFAVERDQNDIAEMLRNYQRFERVRKQARALRGVMRFESWHKWLTRARLAPVI